MRYWLKSGEPYILRLSANEMNVLNKAIKNMHYLNSSNPFYVRGWIENSALWGILGKMEQSGNKEPKNDDNV